MNRVYTIQFNLGRRKDTRAIYECFRTNVVYKNLRATKEDFQLAFVANKISCTRIMTIILISPIDYPQEFIEAAQEWARTFNGVCVLINNDVDYR